VGAMGWLHQDPGPVDRRYRTFVRSGEQEVGPFLLYGQLQESPCATRAPVEAHSLGYAVWAAEEGPSVASGRAADERLGRHATWNDVLEIRLRRFVLFFFFLNWKEETHLEWNVAYHPIRCQWSRIREDRLPT
jgi:hypothetical protein